MAAANSASLSALNPSIRTLPSLVRARMTRPEKIFIHNDDGRSFSFGELWDLSGRLASALLAASAKPGDRIAVQVDKCPEVIALFLACARAGLIFLPLNTAYTLAELAYFLDDATPAVVVATPDRAESLEALGRQSGVRATLTLGTSGNGSLLEWAAVRVPLERDVPADWDTVAAILYTSGTTAARKARC